MSQVGILLLAVGIADLIAGFSGAVSNSWRAASGASFGILIALGAGLASGNAIGASILLAALTATFLVFWLIVRAGSQTDWSQRRALTGLLGFVVFVGVFAASSGSWPTSDGGRFACWIAQLPFPQVSGSSWQVVILVVGAISALMATSNALVRLALDAAGIRVEEATLPGGRVIGPVERLLIFGFAVSGELAAAALVVTAKGLIRFPELSHMPTAPPASQLSTGGQLPAPANLRSVTEYLLSGSMVSWGLALLMALLIP